MSHETPNVPELRAAIEAVYPGEWALTQRQAKALLDDHDRLAAEVKRLTSANEEMDRCQ